MDWNDVNAALQFGTFSNSADPGKIRDALEYIYEKSDKAKLVLHALAGAPQGITIHEDSETSPGRNLAGAGVIAINVGAAEALHYINDKGVFVAEKLGLTVIHELIHDLHDNWSDPNENNNGVKNYDFIGDVVKLQNEIAIEALFVDNIQVGYNTGIVQGADVRFPILLPDEDYYGWEILDSAIFGTIDTDGGQRPDVLDLSKDDVELNNLVLGFGGNDVIAAGAGDDYVYGGGGDDYVAPGRGNDVVFGDEPGQYAGGLGHDIVNYMYGDATSLPDAGVVAEIGTAAAGAEALNSLAPILVANDGSGGRDLLYGVEKLMLTTDDDRVLVGEDALENAAGIQEVDAGDHALNGADELDLSGMTSGVSLINGELGRAGGADSSGLKFVNFEKFRLGEGNDEFMGSSEFAEVHLGGGEDTFFGAGEGSRIYGGTGADRFHFTHQVQIEDADADDRIQLYGMNLTGGLHYQGQDGPYAMHVSGLVGYARNGDDSLVIHDVLRNRDMFIANYVGGPGAPHNDAGIYIASVTYYEGASLAEQMLGFLEVTLGGFMKANFGYSLWDGVDPLVFDLDGDGLELLGRTDRRVFDVDGDGYGERTGWLQRDDGLLVVDTNSDGAITQDELFGGPTESGFSELATYDTNLDGKVDASDTGFADLKIWQDADEDTVTDEGELKSLTELGIVSVSVNGTPSGATIAGNTVAATATFTRADNSTGQVGDVSFKIDNRQTTWLGDDAVSTEAATLPEVKGYGTLTDLRVAMTLDPDLVDVVETAIPTLTSLDLEALRAAAKPILLAWAEASPVGGAPGTLQPHDDIPVFTETVNGQLKVTDFAYEKTDGSGTYWVVGSGRPILDENDLPIARPTLAQILADHSEEGEWSSFDGELVGFMERYVGAPLNLDSEPVSGSGAAADLNEIIDGIYSALNLIAVRLAVQGPLAATFEGITYDAELDGFVANDARGMVPTFENIFEEADALGAGALDRLEEWRPILEVVLGDFHRDGDLNNSRGSLFANIVAAYESVGMDVDIKDVADVLGVPAETIVAGSASLTGTEDGDIIYIAAGDQTAAGGGGSDTYVVGRDAGDVLIDDEEASSHKNDFLRFADVASADVTATREGIDLVLTVAGTDTVIRVKDHFDGRLPNVLFGGDLSASEGVDEIAFADGTNWGKIDIARAVSRPTLDNQVVTGTGDVDWLDGGAGHDVLSGGDDGDVYIYGRGYGVDVIADNSTTLGTFGAMSPDILLFNAGIGQDDIAFSRYGASNDLLVAIDGEDGVLQVKGQFDVLISVVTANEWQNAIDTFEFQDGAGISLAALTNNLIIRSQTAGDDDVFGFWTDDRLDGGAGFDKLDGGEGSDTYVFGRGYGIDYITDSYGPNTLWLEANNKVEFKDIASTEVSWRLVAGDLIASVDGEADAVVVHRAAEGRIVSFEFTDLSMSLHEAMAAAVQGSAGNDYIAGSDLVDTLAGGTGDDLLAGGFGANVYVYESGGGRDVIAAEGEFGSGTGNLHGELRLGAGILPADVTLTDLNDSLLIRIGAGGDEILAANASIYSGAGIYAISKIVFDDGTVWNEAYLTANAVQTGPYGELEGTVDGDTIHLANVNPDDVELRWLGEEGSLKYAVFTPDGVAVIYDHPFGTDKGLTFDDGTVWSPAEVRDRIVDSLATDGNDWVDALGDARTLAGGQGDDVLSGGSGANTYAYSRGDGFDFVREDGRNTADTDTIAFSDIASTEVHLSRRDSNFWNSVDDDRSDLVIDIIGGVGGRIVVKDQFAPIQEAIGIEQITFSDGVTWTEAQIREKLLDDAQTDQDDVVYGFRSADTLEGGAGADLLAGDEGRDTYVWSAGDGHDRIADIGPSSGQSEVDTLILHGVSAEDVEVIATGEGDLTLVAAGSGGSITLAGQQVDRSAVRVLEKVEFDDGTVWDASDLAFLAQGGFGESVTTSGTASADSLAGTSGHDVLDGLAGADTLSGGAGGDLYLFSAGSGNDQISESTSRAHWQDVDGVKLVGLNAADVTVSRVGADMRISIDASGETLTIKGQFAQAGGTTLGHGVERIVFADGEVWGLDEIAEASWIQGTSGPDTVNGTSGDEQFDGGGGNDSITGGDGNDTYRWAAGGGSDTINDQGYGASNTFFDSLELAGVAPDDVLAGWSGNDLHIKFLTGETISVLGQRFAGQPQYPRIALEEIRFGDGSTLDLAALYATPLMVGDTAANTIHGSYGDDVIRGWLGNDTIYGGNGADVFLYYTGDGDDRIRDDDDGGALDELKLADVLSGDITLSINNRDLLVTLSDGAVITVQDQVKYWVDGWGDPEGGIGQIRFADGEIWDRARIHEEAGFEIPSEPLELEGTAGNDTLEGAGADDIINGLAGDDLIDGKGGYDELSGGEGADTLLGGDDDDTFYVEADPGADSIDGGDGDYDSVVISANNDDVVVDLSAGTILIGATTLNVINVEAVYTDAGDDSLLGSAGDDDLNGGDGADTLAAGGGSDWLYAGGGDDRYLITAADGDIWVEDWGGVDVLEFGAGIVPTDIVLSREGTSIVLTNQVSGQIVTLAYQLEDPDTQIDEVHFADNTVWTAAYLMANAPQPVPTSGADDVAGTGFSDSLSGAEGDDYIDAYDGDDTLSGDEGDDFLVGGLGGDTYLYSAGQGDDDIVEELEETSADEADVLVFGAGIETQDVTLSKDSDDLVLTIDGGGSVRLRGQLGAADSEEFPSGEVEEVRFADNTIWTSQDLREMVFTALSTSGDDEIFATRFEDLLSGGDGADRLYGRGGEDTIDGGAGDDEIAGGNGDDLLTGGLGADTFRFFQVQLEGVGSHDTVTDFDVANDVVEISQDLLEDFTAFSAVATQVGADVFAEIDPTHSILLKNVVLANLNQSNVQFG